MDIAVLFKLNRNETHTEAAVVMTIVHYNGGEPPHSD